MESRFSPCEIFFFWGSVFVFQDVPSLNPGILIQVQTLTSGGEEPYTKLVPDLRGVDPDDAFSSVPYEKGFALLYMLEGLLGGPG